MSAAIENALLRQQYVVELVRSTNADGKAFYAYILLEAPQLKKFRQKLATEAVDLSQWGVLLASGLGHEPEQAVHDHIMAKYNKPLTS